MDDWAVRQTDRWMDWDWLTEKWIRRVKRLSVRWGDWWSDWQELAQFNNRKEKSFFFFFIISGISASVASRAYNVGKQVFTTVKAEFQKKAENSAASLPWKLQTVSASVDLMVWTAALQDEQGMSRRPLYLLQSCHWKLKTTRFTL